MGKTRTLIAVAALAAFFLLPHSSNAQPTPVEPTEEQIQSFASEVIVRPDGRIEVRERIDYYFPDQRHGIYRDLPIRYDDGAREYVIPITVRGVTDELGRARPYTLQRTKATLRIKIGDPDVTITGSQTYVIAYEAEGALRYFEDHDELYWNVTGTEWKVPIRRAGATIRLPEGVATDAITIKCFTGPQGSTRQDCIGNVQGSSAYFAANDALTVVVGWPPGIVARLEAKSVSQFEKAIPFLPFAVPLIALGVLWRLWWVRGRDPAGRGTLVVQYDPPDEARPAEVGVLVDETAHLKDVSATLVDLAVRGYLKIRETEKKGLLFSSKDYELERLKDHDDDAELKSFEKSVLRAIFGGGKIAKVSDMKTNHTFYKYLPGIKAQLYEQVVHRGYFPANPDTVRTKFAGIGIVAGVLLFFLPGISFVFSGTMLGNAVLAFGITAVLFVIFAPFMPRRTAAGVAALEHAWGFQEYLSRAEKYRLQWQEKEHIFEEFLPYAMVFGVVDKWAKAFEDMALPPPDWYEGTSGLHAGRFNAVAFVGAISAVDSAAGAAMISTPSESSRSSGGGSGFGGGGSSGGGGGGGGGGSW